MRRLTKRFLKRIFTGACNSKHEAARVVNNCAAYSGAAAELMANHAGLVDCLKVCKIHNDRSSRFEMIFQEFRQSTGNDS